MRPHDKEKQMNDDNHAVEYDSSLGDLLKEGFATKAEADQWCEDCPSRGLQIVWFTDGSYGVVQLDLL